MMNNVLHKFFSVTMALMLLLSTVSWTVEKHLCMGRVMDVALFTHAEDCGMKAGLSLLEDDTAGVKKTCCDDEALTFPGQDDLSNHKSDLDYSQQLFLYSFTTTYLELFVDNAEKEILHNFYPPPILTKDLNILNQVFLI